jgi:hypothetical protein
MIARKLWLHACDRPVPVVVESAECDADWRVGSPGADEFAKTTMQPGVGVHLIADEYLAGFSVTGGAMTFDEFLDAELDGLRRWLARCWPSSTTSGPKSVATSASTS